MRFLCETDTTLEVLKAGIGAKRIQGRVPFD
jgi:hypothetical protein